MIEIIFAPHHLSASVEAGQDIVNDYYGEITAGDNSSVVAKGLVENLGSKIRLSGRLVALHMNMPHLFPCMCETLSCSWLSLSLGCADVMNQREWRIGLVSTIWHRHK